MALKGKNMMMSLVGIIVLLVFLPFFAPSYWVAFLLFCFVYLTVAEMWVIVAGLSGMVLLGVGGLVGIGAYSLVIFSTLFNLPLWISIILSGISGVAVALIVAPTIFRMRGVYFSMSTMVFAQALYSWFSIWSFTGGGAGIIINARVSPTIIYYLALTLAITSIIIATFVMRSNLGLKLRAIGDDEDAALTVGVNAFVCKLYCFLIASFMCSVAGATYFLYPLFVSPDAAFSISWLINTLTASSIGGWTSIEGVIFGVVFVVALQQFFYVRYPGLSMLINGALIVIIFLISPKGIWPAVRDIIDKKLKSMNRPS